MIILQCCEFRHLGAWSKHHSKEIEEQIGSKLKAWKTRIFRRACFALSMAYQDEESYGIYVKNLRHDVRYRPLKENLVSFFRDINIRIAKADVDIHRSHNTGDVYAYIYLANEDEYNHILDFFHNPYNQQEYDLSDVTAEGKLLHIEPKQDEKQRPQSASPGPSTGTNRKRSRSRSRRRKRRSRSRSRSKNRNHSGNSPCSETRHSNKPIIHINNKNMVDESNSEDDMDDELCDNCKHESIKSYGYIDDDDNEILCDNCSRLSEHSEDSRQTEKSYISNSQFNGAVKPLNKSYVINQLLGTENRNLEFKLGGGNYLRDVLKEHVGKYTVAFLNSEGGTLMIGVNDKGEVIGVPNLNQKQEDVVRLRIDEIIKTMRPEVFPQMYRLDFIPVYAGNGKFIRDLKVIELSVHTGHSNQLYENSYGEVFIRRDGSIQGPLRAGQIQEWIRMKFAEEHRKKDQEIRELRDNHKELLSRVEEQEKNEYELRRQVIKLKRVDSKVCVIL